MNPMALILLVTKLSSVTAFLNLDCLNYKKTDCVQDLATQIQFDFIYLSQNNIIQHFNDSEIKDRNILCNTILKDLCKSMFPLEETNCFEKSINDTSWAPMNKRVNLAICEYFHKDKPISLSALKENYQLKPEECVFFLIEKIKLYCFHCEPNFQSNFNKKFFKSGFFKRFANWKTFTFSFGLIVTVIAMVYRFLLKRPESEKFLSFSEQNLSIRFNYLITGTGKSSKLLYLLGLLTIVALIIVLIQILRDLYAFWMERDQLNASKLYKNKDMLIESSQSSKKRKTNLKSRQMKKSKKFSKKSKFSKSGKNINLEKSSLVKIKINEVNKSIKLKILERFKSKRKLLIDHDSQHSIGKMDNAKVLVKRSIKSEKQQDKLQTEQNVDAKQILLFHEQHKMEFPSEQKIKMKLKFVKSEPVFSSPTELKIELSKTKSDKGLDSPRSESPKLKLKTASKTALKQKPLDLLEKTKSIDKNIFNQNSFETSNKNAQENDFYEIEVDSDSISDE